MRTIDTSALSHRQIAAALDACPGDCALTGCCGQRFIGAGRSGGQITIEGVPGNALGAYLSGATIAVHANAQDAVGDTMDSGRIVVHGSVGDAVGYAMRGGQILIRGDAGYRAGIHMKQYGEKVPALVIGGCAGSFLGEYQAGGIILVLGLGASGRPLVGDFSFTGMHGGRVYLRGDVSALHLPAQVTAAPASKDDLAVISHLVAAYAEAFGADAATLLAAPFTAVRPARSDPYRQMYVAN